MWPASQNIRTFETILVLIVMTPDSNITGRKRGFMRRTSGFYSLLFIGIILIGVGLYTGTTSHQVTYQTVSNGVIGHFLADDEKGYLQLKGYDDLYVIDQKNFTPVIKGISTFQNGDNVSFVYAPSETESVDVKSIYSHLQGTGAKVVEITLISDNGNKQNFNSKEYQDSPKGYYQNNWLMGGGLAALGFLLALVAFFVPKSNPAKEGFSIGTPPAGPGGYPQPQPGYPQPDGPPPYGGQYPPMQPGYPPPPQQGYPYNQQQPGNPYGQPPGQ